jgi:hypothetical protein
VTAVDWLQQRDPVTAGHAEFGLPPSSSTPPAFRLPGRGGLDRRFGEGTVGNRASQALAISLARTALAVKDELLVGRHMVARLGVWLVLAYSGSWRAQGSDAEKGRSHDHAAISGECLST